MLTQKEIEELKKESDQMIEGLGPKFFKELHQTLRQKELEAHAKRCKSRDDYHRDAMRRMLIWEGLRCGPIRD